MEQSTRAKLVETYKEGTRVFAEALEGPDVHVGLAVLDEVAEVEAAVGVR